MDANQLLNPEQSISWDYDSGADVLYMSVGEPKPALSVDIGDGLVVRYDEAQSAIVGLTVVGLKARLATIRDGANAVNYLPIANSTHRQFVAGDRRTVTPLDNTLNPNSISFVRDLKARLEDLSQDFNATSERGQTKIKDAILAELQQTPSLGQRAASALKAASEQALLETINHPAAKAVIKGIKAFLESN